jgi:hypothetical protein
VTPQAAVSASNSVAGYPPEASFQCDGPNGQYWSPGDNSGSLRLAFAAPVTFQQLKWVSVVNPASVENFTVSGMNDGDGSWTVLQQYQQTVDGAQDVTPPAFTQATFRYVRLEVTGNSWASICGLQLQATTTTQPAQPTNPGWLAPQAAVSASNSVAGYPPEAALQCNGPNGQYWSPGDNAGSLQLAFASPVTFQQLKWVSVINPASVETFTVSGMNDGDSSWTVLQQYQQTVDGAQDVTPPAFTQATFRYVRLEVTGNSWASVCGVELLEP